MGKTKEYHTTPNRITPNSSMISPQQPAESDWTTTTSSNLPSELKSKKKKYVYRVFLLSFFSTQLLQMDQNLKSTQAGRKIKKNDHNI